jgi:hypothetical protein
MFVKGNMKLSIYVVHEILLKSEVINDYKDHEKVGVSQVAIAHCCTPYSVVHYIVFLTMGILMPETC